jgi:hypothetical protein
MAESIGVPVVHTPPGAAPQEHPPAHAHYGRLFLMAILSFLAMYVLMYAMVDRRPNAIANINQAYMAGLMAAPMVWLELLLMRGVYRDGRRNVMFALASLVVFLACLVAIRLQSGVGDRQFLRAMIPHHAGALLMCEQAAVRDPRIEFLCRRIRENQQTEIEEMRGILDDLSRPTAVAAPVLPRVALAATIGLAPGPADCRAHPTYEVLR